MRNESFESRAASCSSSGVKGGNRPVLICARAAEGSALPWAALRRSTARETTLGLRCAASGRVPRAAMISSSVEPCACGVPCRKTNDLSRANTHRCERSLDRLVPPIAIGETYGAADAQDEIARVCAPRGSNGATRSRPQRRARTPERVSARSTARAAVSTGRCSAWPGPNFASSSRGRCTAQNSSTRALAARPPASSSTRASSCCSTGLPARDRADQVWCRLRGCAPHLRPTAPSRVWRSRCQMRNSSLSTRATASSSSAALTRPCTACARTYASSTSRTDSGAATLEACVGGRT